MALVSRRDTKLNLKPSNRWKVISKMTLSVKMNIVKYFKYFKIPLLSSLTKVKKKAFRGGAKQPKGSSKSWYYRSQRRGGAVRALKGAAIVSRRGVRGARLAARRYGVAEEGWPLASPFEGYEAGLSFLWLAFRTGHKSRAHCFSRLVLLPFTFNLRPLSGPPRSAPSPQRYRSSFSGQQKRRSPKRILSWLLLECLNPPRVTIRFWQLDFDFWILNKGYLYRKCVRKKSLKFLFSFS